MGVTQHAVGSDTSTAISNLMLVTGNYMRPGTGAIRCAAITMCREPATSEPCPLFPGYEKADEPGVSASDRKRGWDCKLQTNQGLDNHEMVQPVLDGKLKAMYLVRGRHVSARIRMPMKSARVFQARVFHRAGHLLQRDLPLRRCDSSASPSLEKEGTFTNTERRIQRLYQALRRWEKPSRLGIVQDIAQRLGPVGTTASGRHHA